MTESLSASPAFGITGGIGAGKSELGRILQSRGYPVVSFDGIIGELCAPHGAASKAILEQFRTTDRAILRERVFTNPDDRSKMEAILHPMVVASAPRRIAEELAQSSMPFAFFEAALLFECDCQRFLTATIAVTAAEELRLERATIRNPEIPRSIIESITTLQLSDAERNSKADFILDNSGTRAELEAKADALLKELQAMILS
jgi:dephospho-CoA kinase